MKTEAVVWMLSIQFSVTIATLYFFYRVFKTEKKSGSDDEAIS